MNLSEDQIIALAPDEASKKAGRDLASLSRWISKGVNQQAIWGQCQGSGSKPYQTQVDFTSLTFKCSCPSRKFPCKHGLGLLLLHAKQAGTFTDTEPPAWVTEWLQKKVDREDKKVEKTSKPVDEASQLKRQKSREQSVEDGIEEVLLWIKDIVRNGILLVPEKAATYFTTMAKRMVDAKAPGLAGMVKTLGNTNFYEEGWQGIFMDQLLRIYLVVSGYKNREALPALLKEDIYNQVGFTQSQDELKEKTGTTDTWLVLGKQTIEEDNVTTERNWLYGIQSCQYALVLQFSVRGQGITFTLTPGMAIQAELVFFPSAQPMRAIIKRQSAASNMPAFNGLHGWQQVAMEETNSSLLVPFKTERPYVIDQLKPVYHANKWWLADREQKLAQIKSSYQNMYTLLSISGGGPLKMVVLGKENMYEPIGIWEGENYTSI